MIVGDRVGEVRAMRRWTQDALSAAMSEVGLPMHRTTIAKIEKGQRPVSASELVALGAALGVSPAFLLVPLDGKEQVQLASKVSMDAEKVVAWLIGYHPLSEESEQTYRANVPDMVHLQRAFIQEETKFRMMEDRIAAMDDRIASIEKGEPK